MPDSYGRPLCTSPRFRCEMSHAAPKVRNANDPAAKANPMMYQIPVKAILSSSAGSRDARSWWAAGRLLVSEAFATDRLETAVALLILSREPIETRLRERPSAPRRGQ